MPLLANSTIPWTTAVTDVADSVGASGDPEMQVRAHKSLRAAFTYLNSKKWDFLQKEAAPIPVIGPSAFNIVSASANATSALVSGGHGLEIDDLVQGAAFVLGTRISATAASSIGFTVAITAGIGSGIKTTLIATANRDAYPLPSDMKAIYSAKLLTSQRPVTPLPRRIYDRVVGQENIVQTPIYYDTFLVGGKSKIRLLNPPAAADVLMIRYFRRLTVPAVTASAFSGALDIPEDYEHMPIAWAKWHCLTDKGQADRATVWISLAKESMEDMTQDQNNQPDEAVMFIPGAYNYGARNPNSVRYVDE